jgi:hypothetical protein
MSWPPQTGTERHAKPNAIDKIVLIEATAIIAFCQYFLDPPKDNRHRRYSLHEVPVKKSWYSDVCEHGVHMLFLEKIQPINLGFLKIYPPHQISTGITRIDVRSIRG